MRNLLLVLIVLSAIIGVSSVFVVQEGQRGILFTFSKIQRDAAGGVVVFEPGMHFKVPFVESVRMLDARVQTLDEPTADRFVTAEKKDLLVDSYVKWRIKDFGKYFLATTANTARAETLLKQYINNGLRTEFGTRTISQIVSGERTELMSQALKQAGKSSEEIGVEILDVRVKKINLPDEISANIFQRMRAERTAVAKEHRARGMEKSEIIRADVDAKVTVMVAEAERNSRTTRGEGDALAAKVYAEAYNKNAEFFSFVRSLEAYNRSFNSKSDILVVQPDSEFFQYMKAPIKR
ncbi:MAG: protease modulator HflC [Gammaproteobacteria bacterium]|nr:protease modulator HflC [Gammaproteobacteria bacterium]